ncbi:MAG: undecaprenyl/decaprenyl-phosphate alpha-N-acetylglucosaminyl 1-phosphate transferase [Actinomycetota bacterium]|nr:undecaprenyl/decaprenyl-phosphate alpha-N-acetylglucosaminyl 1-phosphate transferase [Actinomycetota bacterium]
MSAYLLVGLVALVITFVTTPAVRWFSLKIGAVDQPGDRKVHASPTPTLGGLAILLGILGAGAAASLLPTFKIQFTLSSEPLGIAAGAVIIFALGAVDDLKDLPAPVKLAGQVFAAGILFLAGVKMQYLMLPIHNGAFALSDDVSVLVSVTWIVAMVNAINLVDGLDGLAAGIVAIASSAFFVYTALLFRQGVLNQASSAPLIAIILVGATLGFLRYNFFPAKVFMGDSGAMVLGLVLGAATITGIGKIAPGPLPSAVFLAYFPLVIPLLVIAIPLLDGVFAVVRRARRGRSVFHADKEHIHHRLMDLGHGHRQAVIVMYVWSALAAGAALAFTFLHRSEVIFGLPVAVGAIVLYTLFPLLTKVVQNRSSS